MESTCALLLNINNRHTHWTKSRVSSLSARLPGTVSPTQRARGNLVLIIRQSDILEGAHWLGLIFDCSECFLCYNGFDFRQLRFVGSSFLEASFSLLFFQFLFQVVLVFPSSSLYLAHVFFLGSNLSFT